MVNSWYDRNVEPDISDAIIRLSVKLPGKNTPINRDFRPDVQIDYDTLEKELEETPACFSFWSSVLSEQRAQVAKLERIIKVRKGSLVSRIIGESPSIPKWKVDEMIEADDDLIKYESQLIMARKTESKLFGIVDSIRMKSEHLRSLAGFKRQEMRDSG